MAQQHLKRFTQCPSCGHSEPAEEREPPPPRVLGFRELEKQVTTMAHARGLVFMDVSAYTLNILSAVSVRLEEGQHITLAHLRRIVEPGAWPADAETPVANRGFPRVHNLPPDERDEYLRYVLSVSKILKALATPGRGMCRAYKPDGHEIPCLDPEYVLTELRQPPFGGLNQSSEMTIALQVTEPRGTKDDKIEPVGFISYGAMLPDDQHKFTGQRMKRLKAGYAILEFKLVCVQKNKEVGMGKVDTAKLLVLYVTAKKMKTDRFDALFMDAISYKLPRQPPVWPMESIANQMHFRRMRTYPVAEREVWDDIQTYVMITGTHQPSAKPFLLDGKTEILDRSREYYSTLFRHGNIVDDVRLDDVCASKPRSRKPSCK